MRVYFPLYGIFVEVLQIVVLLFSIKSICTQSLLGHAIRVTEMENSPTAPLHIIKRRKIDKQ